MTDSSAYGQPVAGREPPRRGVWFWVRLAALGLALLAVGGLIPWFGLAGDPRGPESGTIDCADAMRSAGFETLPEGVEPECGEGGFQDPFVTIDFVAPQDDVDAWLRAEIPGTELEQEPCVEVDACLQVSYGEPGAPDNGWTVGVETTDRGDGTVTVEVMAVSV